MNAGENPETQPELIANESDGVASGPPAQEDKSLVLVNVPHVSGVARIPCEPPKKSSLKSVNGNCGLFENVVVN